MRRTVNTRISRLIANAPWRGSPPIASKAPPNLTLTPQRSLVSGCPDSFLVAASVSMSSSQNPYSYLREEGPDSDASTDDTEGNEPDADAPSIDLSFDDEEVGEELRHASKEELNEAPFGIIQLDDAGVVQFYNRYESNLSGVDPEDAVGTNFFTELAPCSNNPLFLGRFKDGVCEGGLDEYFTYTFTYKMRPTLVDVHLYRDEAGNNWIMIQKR